MPFLGWIGGIRQCQNGPALFSDFGNTYTVSCHQVTRKIKTSVRSELFKRVYIDRTPISLLAVVVTLLINIKGICSIILETACTRPVTVLQPRKSYKKTRIRPLKGEYSGLLLTFMSCRLFCPGVLQINRLFM